MAAPSYFFLNGLFSLHIPLSDDNGNFDSRDADSRLLRHPAPSDLGYFPHPGGRTNLPALPRATRNITLLSSAWGAKKRVTSSSKNVRPLAPKR
jgi:hypothetical protein